MSRGRFCKNIAELVRYLLQKCSSPILYHEELSIGDALITRFVFDYRVRVSRSINLAIVDFSLLPNRIEKR